MRPQSRKPERPTPALERRREKWAEGFPRADREMALELLDSQQAQKHDITPGHAFFELPESSKRYALALSAKHDENPLAIAEIVRRNVKLEDIGEFLRNGLSADDLL